MKTRIAGLALIGVALFSMAAAAQKPPAKPAPKPNPGAPAPTPPAPHEIGRGKGWVAYGFTEKGHPVCYLIGHPTKSEPKGTPRGRTDALITHRPVEKAVNVVNFDSGYPFKDGSEASVDIDGAKFTLFTDKESAWAPDANQDKQMTEALAKGKRAVFKGTSARGTETQDTYELEGFAQALAAIDKECKVKR